MVSNFFVISRAMTSVRSPPSASARCVDGRANAMRRFVDDERERQVRDGGEQLALCFRGRRQESQEDEPLGAQTRGRERGDRGVRAGNGHHLEAGVADPAHESRTGIADTRRAGVADDGDAAAAVEHRHDLVGARDLVVLVQREWTRRDPVVAEQHARHARVLGGDHVDAPEDVERAQRQVAEISDRRGDHI